MGISTFVSRHRYLNTDTYLDIDTSTSIPRHRYLDMGISISVRQIDIDTSTSVSRRLYLDIGILDNRREARSAEPMVPRQSPRGAKRRAYGTSTSVSRHLYLDL